MVPHVADEGLRTLECGEMPAALRASEMLQVRARSDPRARGPEELAGLVEDSSGDADVA